jgi:hypothetical protein
MGVANSNEGAAYSNGEFGLKKMGVANSNEGVAYSNVGLMQKMGKCWAKARGSRFYGTGENPDLRWPPCWMYTAFVL